MLVGAGLAAQEQTTRVVMLCGIPFFVWPHDKATKADPEKGPIVAWGLPFRPTHRWRHVENSQVKVGWTMLIRVGYGLGSGQKVRRVP